MISVGFGTPPELHRGVEPTCCLYYGIFSHTHVHGYGLPVGILSASQGGKKMNISGPSRGMYFLIPEFLHLMPWIPLVPVILDFHKPIL